MFGWLKKKATQLQISNTKRDLKILIDTCEKWKEKLVDEELFDPIMSQLVSSMRGLMPKRDLVAKIFDPVLKASNGYDLIPQNAIDCLKEKIFPLSHLLTPNINEIEILSKRTIRNLKDIKKAVKILQNFGAKNILVKGGHFQEESNKVVSFLFLEDQIIKIQNKRLDKNCRGTGCMLSTAIAIFLGADYNLIESVKKANKYVYHKIKSLS